MNVPRPLLLVDDGFQGGRGCTMPAAGIEVKEIDLGHKSIFDTLCEKSSFVTNVLSTRHECVTPRGYLCIMAVLQITMAWVSSRDHRLMLCVNHWHPPKWLQLWML